MKPLPNKEIRKQRKATTALISRLAQERDYFVRKCDALQKQLDNANRRTKKPKLRRRAKSSAGAAPPADPHLNCIQCNEPAEPGSAFCKACADGFKLDGQSVVGAT